MDIRKFFVPGPGIAKDISLPRQKSGSGSNESMTKIKSGNNAKVMEESSLNKKKETNDENCNRVSKKENKQKEKVSKQSKVVKNKQVEKFKLDYELDEVIEVDDDSAHETPLKNDKTKTKEKKKEEPSLSKINEINVEIQNRSKSTKRKQQISDDEDFVIQDEDDDDDVVVRKTKSKKKGKKIQRVFESDSDEDPIPKDRKQKKLKKKNSVVHIGGTDGYVEEEEIVMQKKTLLDNFLKSPTPQNPPKPKAETKITEPVVRAVSVDDFFGSVTIHRTERKVTHVTKPEEVEMKSSHSEHIERQADNDLTEDIEMHSDDDFERTLELLDEGNWTSVKEPSKKSDSENITPAEIKDKSSMSNKLASVAKSNVVSSPVMKQEIIVHDTPEAKQVLPKRAKMEFVMDTPVRSSKTDTTPEKSRAHTPKKTPPKLPDTHSSAKKKPSPVKSESETPGQKGSGYRSYLNRTGPQALGSKEVPVGAENCLEGLAFVITGVLESFERDETKSFIERYGGKVTGNVSKKTDFVVAGRDSGESKMIKAQSFGTKILDEDGLLELIRTRPGKKSKYIIQAEQSMKKESSVPISPGTSKVDTLKQECSRNVHKDKFKSSLSKFNHSLSSKTSSQTEMTSTECELDVALEPNISKPSLLWVDKYKPTQLKQIIGQTGDKSNAKKLFNWLMNWHKNQASGVRPVSGKFFGQGGGDGAGFKAALLSGPPGIGKTTTATLVCQEAGFSFVELNASDTRNAKSLKEVVAQSVGNTSIVDYLASGESTTHGHKHCLVMDEVDGMSGNEDRGGVQELVNIIKATRIPIITMCNDRNHPKMRTLSNYCFDLRFQRPRVEQIKAAVMSIAYKEGLTIPPPAVNEIIIAANQDIRQVIHNLSLWTAASKAVTYDLIKSDAQNSKKDMKLGPFDVCRKVFVGGEETNKMSLNDKSDLFFHDYNIAPLFVQENYIHVIPYAATSQSTRHLSLLARAVDSICDGDLVDRKIRTSQNWTLLPVQAMYASVLPGECMRGNVTQMIAFPSWLGKNSTTTKTERTLQELRTHMRLKISGDKRSLNLDYLPYMRYSLTEPLVHQESEGVKDVIQLMDDYDIIKDDFDNIIEITKWPNSSDPLSKLSTKTKTAFTRMYNKEVHLTPYSTGIITKKKRGRGATEDDIDQLGEGEIAMAEDEVVVEQDEDENDDDLEADTMIKKKTTKKGSKSEEIVGKGKGPAKGKGEPKGKGKR